VARLGPVGLLMAAGIAGIVRWGLMALAPSLPVLATVQLLHAFTFGAGHLAAMHFLQRAAPQGLAAAAQSTYSAVGMGLAMGAALLASGPLYAALGAGAYAAMAGLSAAGLLGALALGRFWNGARLG
jgi:MFS transporter, PPP family, 3-phenylpropionic acid transporter